VSKWVGVDIGLPHGVSNQLQRSVLTLCHVRERRDLQESLLGRTHAREGTFGILDLSSQQVHSRVMVQFALQGLNFALMLNWLAQPRARAAMWAEVKIQRLDHLNRSIYLIPSPIYPRSFFFSFQPNFTLDVEEGTALIIFNAPFRDKHFADSHNLSSTSCREGALN
jgi:hypothetical protein